MTVPVRNSAPKDFDFIIGDWTVRHRRLNERLVGCDSWTEFSGRSSTRRTLGGFGNVEDNVLYFPEGTFHAIAIRSYCVTSGTWSIWWLDGRNPTQLDQPVVGAFTGNIGQFYTDDVFNGKAIKVRFTWLSAPTEDPRWEQASSTDGGRTWEINWTMRFTRLDHA